jgi:hypothetical protein
MNKCNKILIAIVSTASMMMSSNVFAVGLCVGNNPNAAGSYILDKRSTQYPGKFTCQLNGRTGLATGDAVGAVSFGLPAGDNYRTPSRFFSTKYQCTLDFADWDPKINKGIKLYYSYALFKYIPSQSKPAITINVKIPTPKIPINMKTIITFNSGSGAYGDCRSENNCFFYNGAVGHQITIYELSKTDVFSPLTVSCKLIKKRHIS